MSDGFSKTEGVSSPAATVSDSLVGKRISHYIIEQRLGGGGMGVVYRGTDTRLGRPVAIKVLTPSLAADPQARSRFAREARSASALDHPNIATIYEIDEHEGLAFIAMALYEGETLRQRIERGQIPLDEIDRIALQLASALAAAHRAGIAHRDVKPANVVLADGGQLKLLDFGLAKLMVGDPAADTLTAEGAVIGTLLYMAPEQLRGEPVDHRADLWALGAILYEMLAGKHPFAGKGHAVVVTSILHGEAEPVRKLRPDVPPHLEALVERLLCKVPADRMGDSDEVSRALAGRIPIPRPPRRARRFWIGGVALLVAIAVAVAVGATRYRAEPIDEPAAKGVLTPSPESAMTPAEQDRMHVVFNNAAHEFDLKHFDAAAKGFEEVFSTSGEPTILYNAAQAWRLAGKSDRALLLYKSYLRGHPDAPVETRVEVEKRIRSLSSDAPH